MNFLLIFLSLIYICKYCESILQKSFETASKTKLFAAGILLSCIISTASNLNADIKTVSDLPKSYFKSRQTINGNVVKVIDGDTIRIKYLKFPWSRTKPLKKGELLSENTLIIRLAGVDAPETAKFGNPGQELGDEVTNFVKDELLNNNIQVKLLKIDRYNRALGLVKYRNGLKLFEKDLSEILLEKGYATLYKSGGAIFDGKENRLRFSKLENIAKQKGKGIWHKDYYGETPAAYKKKLRSMEKRKVEVSEPIGGRRGIRR